MRLIDAERLCELYTEMKWVSFGDACQAWLAAKVAPTAEEVKRPSEEPYLEQMMAEVERSHSDEEVAHSMADGILCDLLTELGYERLVKAFGDVWKWYA